MNTWRAFLLSILFIRVSFSNHIPDIFISQYFDKQSVHHINIFGCWNDSDALQFSRRIMKLDSAISYSSISAKINLLQVLRVNYYRVGVILDLSCVESDIILDKFSQQLAFNGSYLWLLLTNLSAPPTNILQNLPLTIESELTVVTNVDNKLELYDVYNPSYAHGGVLNITYRGYWSLQNGLKDQYTQFKYKRRNNFHLLPLNISTVLRHKPLPDLQTYLETPVNRHLDTMSRYSYALILQLRDMYNFSINLKCYDTWGYLVNGTFGGVLGDLLQGYTDATAATFQFKSERMDVVEYTVTILNVQLRFFFRHPKNNDLQNNFVKPFTMSLWRAIFVLVLAYWILMMIFGRYKRTLNDAKLQTNSVSESPFMTIVAALSQQGVNKGPEVTSERTIFFFLLLWALLLFQFYSASIVGSLLAPPTWWITTLDNLTDSHLECSIEDIPYMADYFATTADRSAQELYRRKIKPTKKYPHGRYVPVNEGLQKVRSGGYAFHVNVATGYKIIENTFAENEICEMQQIDMVGACPTAIVTKKKSPFVNMMKWALAKSIESGLTQRLHKIWHHQSPKCPENYNTKPTPVSIKQFGPAIFLLLLGIGSAMLILMVECLHSYRCQRYKDKDENNPVFDCEISQSGN